MPSTVPLSQHHNFGICDKGFPHSTQHKDTGTHHNTQVRIYLRYLLSCSIKLQKKAQTANNYLDLLYVLKGFLDWSITHLTFYYPKLTYQCMLSIHHTFNFIYININILPTFIVNPYLMQITLHIKVFFKS